MRYTQKEKNELFKKIADDMLETYAAKNELYGDSFNKQAHKWGLVAAAIPLDNKVERISSIIKGSEVKFESLEDSLVDLACYSILTLIHLKELEYGKTQHEEEEGKQPACYVSRRGVREIYAGHEVLIGDIVKVEEDVALYEVINIEGEVIRVVNRCGTGFPFTFPLSKIVFVKRGEKDE